MFLIIGKNLEGFADGSISLVFAADRSMAMILVYFYFVYIKAGVLSRSLFCTCC